MSRINLLFTVTRFYTVVMNNLLPCAARKDYLCFSIHDMDTSYPIFPRFMKLRPILFIRAFASAYACEVKRIGASIYFALIAALI